MASTQSRANREHWETAAGNGPQAPDAVIEWNDIHWTPLTAEPRGVDYIEVDADGAPAMWIRPKGAVEDRVIFYSHGGGFVSGSIYTHRKLVGHLAKALGCRGLLFEFPYAHERKHPAQRSVGWPIQQTHASADERSPDVARRSSPSGASRKAEGKGDISMINPPLLASRTIGSAENALCAILERTLTGTGLDYHRWVALKRRGAAPANQRRHSTADTADLRRSRHQRPCRRSSPAVDGHRPRQRAARPLRSSTGISGHRSFSSIE
jgi:hypothetical protein